MMFGIGKNREVGINVISDSTSEKKLMDIFRNRNIRGMQCELGILFGRITESGDFVNKYIISKRDYNKIKNDIELIG